MSTCVCWEGDVGFSNPSKRLHAKVGVDNRLHCYAFPQNQCFSFKKDDTNSCTMPTISWNSKLKIRKMSKVEMDES